MLKIREHGLQQRERSRVYPNKPSCASGQNFGSVRWRDCYAAVLILGCGIIISISTFSVEAIVKFQLKAGLRERIRQLKYCSSLLSSIMEDEEID